MSFFSLSLSLSTFVRTYFSIFRAEKKTKVAVGVLPLFTFLFSPGF